MKFSDLGLSEPIVRAVTAEGYTTPTPIQAQSIPHVLAGRDVLGCAQTGTGKTAAFSLPLVHRLMEHMGQGKQHHHGKHSEHAAPHADHRPIRALILSPTRELALQILESLSVYGRHSGLRHVAIFGGVNQNPQTRALRAGVDIVVATPGRLEDLMQQGFVDLSHVKFFVLDEADRMLDMGFIQPIRRIAAAVPTKRQTLLFSATMPTEIKKLADSLLTDPAHVQVAPQSSLPDRIGQSVYHVPRSNKVFLLKHVLTREYIERALVFTKTKHGADKLVRSLHTAGIKAEAIHGNKRQNVRQRTLENFRSGRTHILVATDIAARGIDVDDVTHVVNFDIPHEPETYVHRIGRTGRAGAKGVAVSFCDSEERYDLKAIERLLKRPIEVKSDHPEYPPPGERQHRETSHREYGHRDSSHREHPSRDNRGSSDQRDRRDYRDSRDPRDQRDQRDQREYRQPVDRRTPARPAHESTDTPPSWTPAPRNPMKSKKPHRKGQQSATTDQPRHGAPNASGHGHPPKGSPHGPRPSRDSRGGHGSHGAQGGRSSTDPRDQRGHGSRDGGSSKPRHADGHGHHGSKKSYNPLAKHKTTRRPR